MEKQLWQLDLITNEVQQWLFQLHKKLARKHWDHAGRFQVESSPYGQMRFFWTASSTHVSTIFKCRVRMQNVVTIEIGLSYDIVH